MRLQGERREWRKLISTVIVWLHRDMCTTVSRRKALQNHGVSNVVKCGTQIKSENRMCAVRESRTSCLS